MSKIFFKGKNLSTAFLIAFLILTCGILMSLKVKTDHIAREKIPGSTFIYIPSGKFLKYATFGYSSLLADLIYIWSIQYYSDPSILDRFESLDHTFSIIAELDPHYLDPYEIGAIIAVYDAKDLETAFKILDRGLEKNPDQWIFPYQAGHYAQMKKKDHKLAQKYYRETMKIEGAPDAVKRLYADTAYKLADLQTSWKSWLKIYQKAKDERIRKIASNHLYQVKVAADIQMIKEALRKFKEKYSRNPLDLTQLVQAGFLTKIPKDLDGKDYLYDSQTEDVKASIQWWKR